MPFQFHTRNSHEPPIKQTQCNGIRNSNQLGARYRPTAMPLLANSTDRSAEPECRYPNPTLSYLRKRKRHAENAERPGDPERSSLDESKVKAQKVREDGIELDWEQRVDSRVGRMDSRLLADYTAQSVKRYAADLSLTELEDLYIPGWYGPECQVSCELKT